MNDSDDSDKAAFYLRQAIPKMVAHNIAPNPLNYALWYSYFSNQFSELNKDLESTIERYGTCPAEVGKDLFVRHISKVGNNEQEQIESFQQAFAHTVNSLSTSLDSTALETNSITAALKEDLGALKDCDLDTAIAPVIHNLSTNATALCNANEAFQGKLSEAQAEINALKMKLDKSQEEANTDQLTGLFNRRFFESAFNKLDKEKSEQDKLALIIMDIDKFKTFNDTYGHIKGDQILQFVGSLLKSECPDDLTAVRFGGEEFAILCPDYEIEKAAEVAEKIRTKLASVSFSNKKTGEKIPPVTASFGITTKRANEMLTQVVERADKALYKAKDGGRNQVQRES